MSIRCPTLLSALALWITTASAPTSAFAQAPAEPATTPAPPNASGETTDPVQAEGGEVQAPTESADTAAPPAGMVFDPTTGRYMPVSEQLPWRNSFFIFDNSVNHTGLDNSTLSDTGYWVQTFSLRPRWNFTDTLSLRLRQDIFTEWVASTTSSESQPVVLDTQLDLVEASLVTFEGVIIGVGGRLLLPTSLQSRHANRVVATGGTTSATKVFGDVLAGLITQVGLGYTHWWATSTTPTGYEPTSLCIDDNALSQCTRFNTSTAVRDQITASVFAGLNFTPDFSAGVSFSWLWQRGSALGDVNPSVIGPGVVDETLPDRSATHWRNLTSSSLFVAYQVNTWLQASLGMNSLTSQLNPNGSVRNPFWNPDTQYSLTAVVTLDQLYTAIKDVGTEEQAPVAQTTHASSPRM